VLITLFSSTHTFHLLAWQNTDFVGMRIPATSSSVKTLPDVADSPTDVTFLIHIFVPPISVVLFAFSDDRAAWIDLMIIFCALQNLNLYLCYRYEAGNTKNAPF
jgi:hypothetical protein